MTGLSGVQLSCVFPWKPGGRMITIKLLSPTAFSLTELFYSRLVESSLVTRYSVSVIPVAASGQLKCKGGPGGEGPVVLCCTPAPPPPPPPPPLTVHQHRYRPALWQLSHHILWSLSSGLTLGRITQECQLWMEWKPLDFLWYLALIECTGNSIYHHFTSKQLLINRTPHCPLLKKVFPPPC